LAGGLVLLVASCDSNPSPSGPTTSPDITAPSTQSVSPSASFVAPTIAWEAVDQAWTTPLLAVATTGSEVIWSAGPEADGNFAPDLYRYSIETATVERLIRSPSRASNLLPIAGSATGYAYVEQLTAEDGRVRWILWYLPAEGGDPIQVDAMDSDEGLPSPAPSIAISDRWLVWGTAHQRSSGPTSELRVFDLTSQEARVLDSGTAAVTEFWFPALDRDELVYGVVENGPGGSTRMVFHRDLSTSADAVRLDTSGRAAMPVISGETVVWKESPDNAFTWGSLVRYSLTTHEEQAIDFGAERALNNPSLGNRFLAAWAQDPTRFSIFDLLTNRIVLVEEFEPDSAESNVRPYVRGDLLAWSHVPPAGDLELRWAALPD